jgi:hypothetical protein
MRSERYGDLFLEIDRVAVSTLKCTTPINEEAQVR